MTSKSDSMRKRAASNVGAIAPATPKRNTTSYASYSASRTTPMTLQTTDIHHTTEKKIIQNELRRELNGRIFKVDTEEFIKTFLYPSDHSKQLLDADRTFGANFRFPDHLNLVGLDDFTPERQLQRPLAQRLDYIRRAYQRNPTTSSPPWENPVLDQITMARSQVMTLKQPICGTNRVDPPGELNSATVLEPDVSSTLGQSACGILSAAMPLLPSEPGVTSNESSDSVEPTPTFLSKSFRVTGNAAISFSRRDTRPLKLLPDITLLNERWNGQASRKTQSGSLATDTGLAIPTERSNSPITHDAQISSPTSDADSAMALELSGSSDAPKNPPNDHAGDLDHEEFVAHSERAFCLHYSAKDSILPVEIKPKGVDGSSTLQNAEYVRALKYEQYDRSFVFSATMSYDEFRLWRWDSGCCYVTEPIFYRIQEGQPLPYKSHRGQIQLPGFGLPQLAHIIGRICGMTPAEHGFDQSFDHAGTVLADVIKRENPSRCLTLTDESGEESRFLLREMLCERYDPLFSRATRVWRARAIDGTQPGNRVFVIKQNWQDVTRSSEADFYKKIKRLDPRFFVEMQAFQDMKNNTTHGRTCDWRRGDLGLSPEAIKGHYTIKQDMKNTWRITLNRKESSRPIIHRSLVRFVFSGEGRPLSQAKSPLHILYAARDIVDALEILDKADILHRDLSPGNILLRGDDLPPGVVPAPGTVAYLIDFGLAICSQLSQTEAGEAGDPHAHFTGTLPFIARARLQDIRKRLKMLQSASEQPLPPAMMHTLQHDLESLFWVLLWVVTDNCEVLLETREELDVLKHGDLLAVIDRKKAFISDRMGADFTLIGFEWMKDFFRDFAGLCRHPENLTTADVRSLIQRTIDAAPSTPQHFIPRVKTKVFKPKTGEKRSLMSLEGTELESGASERSIKKMKKKSTNPKGDSSAKSQRKRAISNAGTSSRSYN